MSDDLPGLSAGMQFKKRYIDSIACTEVCLLPNGEGGATYGLYGQKNVSFSNYNTLVGGAVVPLVVALCGLRVAM